MTKKFFGLMALATLILAGCASDVTTNISEEVNTNLNEDSINANVDVKTNTNTNTSIEVTNTNTNTNINTNINTNTTVSEVKAVAYVEYVNKALNYSIQRPDRWYWQHYIGNQLGSFDALVDDLFITDRESLPPVAIGYDQGIIIEVSRHNLGDFNVQGLSKSESTIDGVSAARYEGTQPGKNNVKHVEYHFADKTGKTYRIIYNRTDGTDAEEQIFEKVVAGFKFGK